MCQETEFLNKLLELTDEGDYNEWTLLGNICVKSSGLDIDGFPTYFLFYIFNKDDKYFYEYHHIDFSEYTLIELEEALLIDYESIDDLLSRGNDLFLRIAECLVKSGYSPVEYTSQKYSYEDSLMEELDYFKNTIDKTPLIWK